MTRKLFDCMGLTYACGFTIAHLSLGNSSGCLPLYTYESKIRRALYDYTLVTRKVVGLSTVLLGKHIERLCTLVLPTVTRKARRALHDYTDVHQTDCDLKNRRVCYECTNLFSELYGSETRFEESSGVLRVY